MRDYKHLAPKAIRLELKSTKRPLDPVGELCMLGTIVLFYGFILHLLLSGLAA